MAKNAFMKKQHAIQQGMLDVGMDNIGCAKLFCERWKGHPEVDPTDFCSYGERRTDNE